MFCGVQLKPRDEGQLSTDLLVVLGVLLIGDRRQPLPVGNGKQVLSGEEGGKGGNVTKGLGKGGGSDRVCLCSDKSSDMSPPTFEF